LAAGRVFSDFLMLGVTEIKSSCTISGAHSRLRDMRKSVAVFMHDANPAIDAPAFFITRTEADTRIGKNWRYG